MVGIISKNDTFFGEMDLKKKNDYCLIVVLKVTRDYITEYIYEKILAKIKGAVHERL